MNTFPITEFFWNENEGDWHDTGKILGYEVLGKDGKVLGKGESKIEAEENAYAAMYPPQFHAKASKKVKPRRKLTLAR